MEFKELEPSLKALEFSYNEYIKKYKKASVGLELLIQHLDAEVRKASKLITEEINKED